MLRLEIDLALLTLQSALFESPTRVLAQTGQPQAEPVLATAK